MDLSALEQLPPNSPQHAEYSQLKNIITAFGWRGRRGLSKYVGNHPNNFLLYSFFGSKKCIGIALRTALFRTTKSNLLIGDNEYIRPILEVLQSSGISASSLHWRFGHEFPTLPSDVKPILCEVPESYEDFTSLAELRDATSGKISTLWELVLPYSVLMETMLLVDYNIGVADRNNETLESLDDYEEYFDAMCKIYVGAHSLLPTLPKLKEEIGFENNTIIEFGPSDGIHTGYMISAGAKHITVVEGRAENVLKLLAAKYAFNWDNVDVIFDNFQYAGPWASKRYDLVFAHGVFYHCLNPFLFLEMLVSISDVIFLGGWVATESRKLSQWSEVTYRDEVYRAQEYGEVHHFLSGLAAKSVLLDQDSVERFFNVRGYEIELLERVSLPTGLTDCFLRWIARRQQR